MNQETKKCQNCQKEFTIEPEDFEFYEKIKVPAPTWCPECRVKRRMNWRNERTLYKRQCDMCGKSIISMFQQETPFTVYCYSCWWSDKWDVLSYAQKYDFEKSFFEQFQNLNRLVPKLSLYNVKSINSEYCNFDIGDKNCYLCFSSAENEDCLYIDTTTMYNKDCLDSFRASNCELCYETANCSHCYKVVFSENSEDCRDSAFLKNCRNCSNCFGCINLRNKEYTIFNKTYSKEEYFSRIKEFQLGNFRSLLTLKEKISKLGLNHIFKFAVLNKCTDCLGDVLNNSKNAQHCFYAHDIEDSKYIYFTAKGDTKDCQDLNNSYQGTDFCFDVVSVGEGARNVICSIKATSSYDVYYSDSCRGSSNLFGCIGLRNKQYCILNKQYTKEEYEELVPKIIQQMNEMPYTDKQGRVYKYGEFFPPEISPFAYNETMAQEYFPLTKEQALAQGYSWHERPKPEHSPTIKASDLQDNIKDVKDDILNEIIECANASSTEHAQCTTAFKIIPQELEFYRKMNLPLPRLCPNCRHYQRIKQRNPLKLWKRQCQCAGVKSENGVYINTSKHAHGDKACPNTFQTTYSSDRPEIVYCEKCYLSEVV